MNGRAQNCPAHLSDQVVGQWAWGFIGLCSELLNESGHLALVIDILTPQDGFYGLDIGFSIHDSSMCADTDNI